MHGNFDSYVVISDKFMQLQSQLYAEYIKRIQNEIASNPKHFWRFVNGRRNRNDIPSVVKFDGECADSDLAKSKLFANFFEKQYVQGADIDLDVILDDCTEDALNVIIEEHDVRKAIESINMRKGPGPDGISPILLKNCVHALTTPLTILFRKSLERGEVPPALKKSRIVPIFKSGNKCDITNYRAVVIIPTVAKIFEIVISDKIDSFVRGKTSQNQHGFVKGRSTTTNLLQMVNYTKDAMNLKCQTEVLYTDFEKAFDRVNHGKLLKKLARFGFGRKLIKWFHEYLVERTQFLWKLVVVSRQLSPSPQEFRREVFWGPVFLRFL